MIYWYYINWLSSEVGTLVGSELVVLGTTVAVIGVGGSLILLGFTQIGFPSYY